MQRILLLCTCLMTFLTPGKGNIIGDTTSYADTVTRKEILMVIRVSPSLLGEGLAGGNLHLEKGVGDSHWAVNMIVRGRQQVDNLGVSFPAHLRLESQLRYYLTEQWRGLYIFPQGNLSTTGSIGIGAGMGGQFWLFDRMAIDTNISFQNSNKTDPYDGAVFLRVQASIGFSLLSKKNAT